MSKSPSVYQVLDLSYHRDVGVPFSKMAHLDGAVWLDSGSPKLEACTDIIGLFPYQTLLKQGHQSYLIKDSQKEALTGEPLSLLETLINDCPSPLEDCPMISAAIGYVSYDYGMQLQGIQARDKKGLALPELYFAFFKVIIKVDHCLKKTRLYYLKRDKKSAEHIKALWDESSLVEIPFSLKTPFTPDISESDYGGLFDTVKAHLIAGDSYQVNLSHSFSAAYEGEELTAYRYLRHINPMPYSAFMRVGHQTILSFSPELFFKADDFDVITKPIKGTIAREKSKAHDDRAKQRLLSSLKDRAENTMIVDLLRNDLSKVCEPRSLKVPALCALETFATVHHLVSTVTATLSATQTHFDLFRALFPCGSITGAPKHETMKIIDRLEYRKRNVYCGSIGYISKHHTQFNVAIRTLMADNNQLYCHGGGGIVLASEKDKEYQETLDKISILTEALGSCCNHETINLRTISSLSTQK